LPGSHILMPRIEVVIKSGEGEGREWDWEPLLCRNFAIPWGPQEGENTVSKMRICGNSGEFPHIHFIIPDKNKCSVAVIHYLHSL
jgi:hypothetical protein